MQNKGQNKKNPKENKILKNRPEMEFLIKKNKNFHSGQYPTIQKAEKTPTPVGRSIKSGYVTVIRCFAFGAIPFVAEKSSALLIQCFFFIAIHLNHPR